MGNNGSGFFGNPGKAFSGFMSDPLGKIGNDLDKLTNVQKNPTPQQEQCYDKCFDLAYDGDPSFTDKRRNEKLIGQNILYSHCNKQCNK